MEGRKAFDEVNGLRISNMKKVMIWGERIPKGDVMCLFRVYNNAFDEYIN